jgi:hypothetical protein
MKIPDPHKIDHRHYKRCCGAGLLGVLFVNFISLHFLGVFEAVVGLLILYDPTDIMSA